MYLVGSEMNGCDNYQKLPKSTENLRKSKLPQTNPKPIANPNPNPEPWTTNPERYTLIITKFSVSFRYR